MTCEANYGFSTMPVEPGIMPLYLGSTESYKVYDEVD